MRVIGALVVVLIVVAAALGISFYFNSSGSGLPSSKFEFREPPYAASTLPHLRVEQKIDFTNGQNRSAMLSGWSGPEPQGVWTNGTAAYLGLVLDKGESGASPRALVLKAAPFVVPGKLTEQEFEVWAQGKKLGDYVLKTKDSEVEIPLSPLNFADGEPLILGLHLPDASSPKNLQGRADPRLLALWLRAVEAR